MGLESPSQLGAKGGKGSGPDVASQKLASPNQVGSKGDKGSAPANAGGTLISPNKNTASSEANGHK